MKHFSSNHTPKSAALYHKIRDCRLCQATLPLTPRPILRLNPRAKILIISQAPGLRAHEQDIAWQDASGRRLRQWLGVDEASFYQSPHFAILPMGFCYPGKSASGDKLPSPICAPTWHEQCLALLPQIKLSLLVGRYAALHYLPHFYKNLHETLINWRDYGPNTLPLPHPSWHNTSWLKRNSWFETELLEHLQARVKTLIQD